MVAMYREARERAALTAQQAATQLDISITTLLSWENGKTSPSALKLVELCRLYDCMPNELLGFVDFQK